MSVIRLLFEQIALKKRAISWKKRIFLLFLTVITPIFAQEQIASVTLRSVACFLRATGVICSQRSLKKSYCEQITPVTLYKRATVSDSLPSLMTKEPWEQFTLFHKQITLSLTKNEQFTQKTNEQIGNPGFRWWGW